MQELRVDTAAVQAMSTNWGASAAELTSAPAPSGIHPSIQASAAAVSAAHGDVKAFTTALATRVDMRANHVGEARTRYIAGEAHSANELSTLGDSTSTI